MKRIAMCFMALLFAALLLACAAGDAVSVAYMLPAPSALPAAADGEAGDSGNGEWPEPASRTLAEQDGGSGGFGALTEVSYTRTEQEYEGSFISYPYIMDEKYQGFNGAIEDAIRSAMEELDASAYIRCDIMCNGGGIFSVRITVRDLVTNETLAIIPLTFSTEAEAEITLADLFDPENERWRGLIPDIVMLQAEREDITLLSDVMPASDTQMFYVTEDALVILYRPYEIATYSAGWPEFSIPLSQLSDFLLPDGALMRLAGGGAEAAAENAAAEPTPAPVPAGGSTQAEAEGIKP